MPFNMGESFRGNLTNVDAFFDGDSQNPLSFLAKNGLEVFGKLSGAFIEKHK